MKNLYVTIPVGQSVRDFLILGTVDRLLDLLPDFRVVILSPSYNVPEFLDLCPKHERAVVRRMELPVGGPNWRLIHWRRKFHHRLRSKLMMEVETRRFKLPQYLAGTFEELPPSVVVSTHPMLYHDYEVVTWARRLGIQTLGVVKSWDNIQKGLSSHCHLLSVWNPVNKEEAVRLVAIGTRKSRSMEPLHLMRITILRTSSPVRKRWHPWAWTLLDASPLATLGILDKEFYGRDETHLVEDILRMIRESKLLQGAQLVIRLHPTSHLECFWKYMNRKDIKVSFASVMPGLMWCPSRQDLVEQTSLLQHSDVILTPGSSWVLEAAIFDTPTIVPVYSDLQPDHATAQFQRWRLARHYKPLRENGWVPITSSYQETRAAIEEAFTCPEKHADGRKAIVDNYVYYRNSGSGQRVSEWIAGIAGTAIPGKPRGF